MSTFHVSQPYVDIRCTLERPLFHRVAVFLECHCNNSEFNSVGPCVGMPEHRKVVLKVATHELEAVKKRLIELDVKEIEE